MTQIDPQLRNRLRQFGQEHVLARLPALTEDQRRSLLAHVQAIDLARLRELFANRERGQELPPIDAIQPVSPVDLRAAGEDVRRLGEDALRRGAVAALVVAGGQGTRLGAEQPKGMFPVGPISGKSLFQIHAEKVLALRRRYRARLPFLVMTSVATDQKTRDYFTTNDYFGLPRDEVIFFCQGTMPAVDSVTGQLLLAAPDRLSLSPNGHGGTLLALREARLLDRLRAEGVRHLFYFQVDNPLVQVAEPLFLGYHCKVNAEVSIKVLPKDGPDDKLGNLVQVGGRCQMIEYSDLPSHLARAADAQGRLRFAMGSPAIHIFDMDFLDRVVRDRDSLPYHLARKKVPFLNEAGQRVEPKDANAIKFEMFIFDTFPLAERWSAVLTARAEEFAPLKNDSGPDSPETVRRALSLQAASWLRRAGATVPADADLPDLEISPLFALDAEELAARIEPRLRVTGPLYLQ